VALFLLPRVLLWHFPGFCFTATTTCEACANGRERGPLTCWGAFTWGAFRKDFSAVDQISQGKLTQRHIFLLTFSSGLFIILPVSSPNRGARIPKVWDQDGMRRIVRACCRRKLILSQKTPGPTRLFPLRSGTKRGGQPARKRCVQDLPTRVPVSFTSSFGFFPPVGSLRPVFLSYESSPRAFPKTPQKSL